MVEKKGQQIRAGVSPPLFGKCPKKYFFREVFPMLYGMDDQLLDKTRLRPGRQGAFSSLVHVLRNLQWCLSQRICKVFDRSSKLIMPEEYFSKLILPVEYFIKRITGDPSTFERFPRFMIDHQS